MFSGKNKAKQYLDQILAQYNGINPPTIEEQKVILEKLVQQGLVTPEDAQTVNLGDTATNGIALDPASKQAQMEALAGLQEVSNEGGMTGLDLQKMQDLKDNFETTRRGDEQAIIENAKNRGVYGSNLELTNRLISGQNAANRASREAIDIGAQAQNARMAALRDVGSLGGQIRGQEFGEASKKAEAQDAINRFNAQNKQNQVNFNVGNRNQAQATNLGEKQRVSDLNIGNENANRVRNSQLIQQKYNNTMGLADAKARALAGIADSEEEAQRQKNQLAAGLIGLGGSTMASYKK
jgi:hypothetical protein